MTWRVAKSLDKLLAQLNAYYPRRSKVSDGGIGDAAHSTRDSDHNPWVKDGATGIVTARDYTHDPAAGLDCEELYQALVASRDPRIKYVIWNRTITSGAGETQPWKRRPYSGSNAHTKHLHLSVRPERSRYDDVAPWAIEVPAAKPASVPAPAPAAAPKEATVLQNYPLTGNGTVTLACPVGKASAVLARAWFSAIGRGTVRVYEQTDTAGIRDWTWPLTEAKGLAQRKVTPITDGATRLVVQYDFPDGGTLVLEGVPK
jgi:hypothetical protein